ncbi:PAS domain S-box protein [Rubrobacter tropicus]|uniref:PAS domain S-box protein n=1 Tax=Rubrobacter tropicus TaxID=2653851 RepID=A0A6G8QCX6_9ACTN|nr:PAS domain S-box protein [Rubrobacter tropicus]
MRVGREKKEAFASGGDGREAAEAALKESEANYRALIEDLPELICRSLPDLTRTYVNEGYCRYFGKSREELLGSSFLDLLPEKDRGPLQEHLASLTPEDPVDAFEHWVWRHDGEVRWQQWTNRAVFDEGATFSATRRWAGTSTLESSWRRRSRRARSASVILCKRGHREARAALPGEGPGLRAGPGLPYLGTAAGEGGVEALVRVWEDLSEPRRMCVESAWEAWLAPYQSGRSLRTAGEASSPPGATGFASAPDWYGP